MVYFDNGATTFPKPRQVEAAVLQGLRQYGANPGRSGHTLSLKTAEKVYECREDAARLFHVEDPQQVVFTANCTHALNIAIKGVLQEGDHVIISDLEHNSVLRPVHALAGKGMISYSVACVSEDADETAAAFEALLTPQTKLIACTHGSNVFGICLPVEKLGRLAAKHDILFLVDGAQTAGVVDIDIPGMKIDFLCTAGHKSLYGPSGTGLLITPLGNVLEPLTEGGTGTLSAQYEMPLDMPERLESGTVNTMGILGLGAGIRCVQKTGVEAIYRHEMEIGTELYGFLQAHKKVELYTTGFEQGRHLPVIAFNIEGLTSEETTGRLSDMGFALRGGLHCAPLAHRKMGTLERGTARISIGAMNTKEQAKMLCRAIERVAKGA